MLLVLEWGTGEKVGRAGGERSWRMAKGGALRGEQPGTSQAAGWGYMELSNGSIGSWATVASGHPSVAQLTLSANPFSQGELLQECCSVWVFRTPATPVFSASCPSVYFHVRRRDRTLWMPEHCRENLLAQKHPWAMCLHWGLGGKESRGGLPCSIFNKNPYEPNQQNQTEKYASDTSDLYSLYLEARVVAYSGPFFSDMEPRLAGSSAGTMQIPFLSSVQKFNYHSLCRPLDPHPLIRSLSKWFPVLKGSLLRNIAIFPSDPLWRLKSGADLCVFGTAWAREAAHVKVGPWSQRWQCWHENIRLTFYHLLPASGFLTAEEGEGRNEEGGGSQIWTSIEVQTSQSGLLSFSRI